MPLSLPAPLSRHVRVGRSAHGAAWTQIVASQLARRLLTGAVAAPVVVILIREGGPYLAAFVALLLAVAVYELAAGMGLGLRDPVPWLAAAGAAAMVAVALIDDVPTAWPFTAALIAVVATPAVEEGWAARRGGGARPLATAYTRTASGIVALAYVGWLGSYFILLRELDQGLEWLLLAAFSVMAADTGAYAVGSLGGVHKLAPRISPGKTLEGAAGGLAFGFAAVVLINLLLPDLQQPFWKMALLGLVLPAVTVIGDLTGSVVKRALQVKDFSHLVPGHGGVLDRLDSLLLGVPTVYFFVQWFVL